MMEILVGILAFTVAVLAVIQGWQMVKKKNNPSGFNDKLDIIITKLSTMEMRLSDIWEKIK